MMIDVRINKETIFFSQAYCIINEITYSYESQKMTFHTILSV